MLLNGTTGEFKAGACVETISRPDLSPDAFELYVQWLYLRTVPVIGPEASNVDVKELEDLHWEETNLPSARTVRQMKRQAAVVNGLWGTSNPHTRRKLNTNGSYTNDDAENASISEASALKRKLYELDSGPVINPTCMRLLSADQAHNNIDKDDTDDDSDVIGPRLAARRRHPRRIQRARSSTSSSPQPPSETSIITDEADRLIDAYILAEYLNDFNFADAVIDCLIDRANTEDFIPNLDQVDAAFEKSEVHSPLRNYFVDMYAYPSLSGAGEDMPGPKHLEFLKLFYVRVREPRQKDIAIAMRNAPWLKDTCIYHKHTNLGKPRYQQGLATSHVSH